MKKWKIGIDLLLLLDTILLLDVDRMGRLTHEILGIAMAILLIVHLAFNWNWVKQVTKNIRKVNTKTKMIYLIDILTMVIYFGAIGFGISISNELFKFETASNLTLTVLHLTFGRLAVGIMMVHLGIHFDQGLQKIQSTKIKTMLYLGYIVLTLLVLGVSLYFLTHSFQWAIAFS